MTIRFLSAVIVPLASLHAAAQPPSPIVQPRVAPRAEYVLTTGVTGTVPTNRHWSQAASNATSMFVFGGRTGTSGSGSRRNDLWEFDATTLTWIQHNADGDPSAPPGRFQSACAWDPLGNRLIVFGGVDAVGTRLNDTWSWDSTSGWTNISPATSPSARSQTVLAYDPTLGSILMFGGQDASGALGDTWLLAGNNWAPLNPPTSPGPRGGHSLVTRELPYGDVFLSNGLDFGAAPNRIHYTDAWRWDGNTANWVQITTTTTAVNASVAGNQAIYDPIRERVILTGGNGLSTNFGGTGGAYGTEYGGSPTNWTSEFDCVSNQWKLYGAASFGTGDPVIGRASRYYSAFIPATGTVYFWGGQNPSGRGAALTAMKEYQATTLAGTTSYGMACQNSAGAAVDLSPTNAPWTCRDFGFTVSGLSSPSLSAVLVAFGQANIPVPLDLVFPAQAGCSLLVDPIVGSIGLVQSGGSASVSLPLADDPNSVGLPLNLQVVQVETVGPAIAWVSASNGLSVQVGLN